MGYDINIYLKLYRQVLPQGSPQPTHLKCQHFNRLPATKKNLCNVLLTLITGHNLLAT